MFPLLFISLILFSIIIMYTYTINKFISNAFVLFLPTVGSILWYLWQLRWYLRTQTQGFEGLSLFFTAFFVIIIVFTNISFGIYFLNRKKHSRKKGE